jgi:OmcA/MtrC family decaheme c-type cytochrome
MDQSRAEGMWSRWSTALGLALTVLALAGCGGGDTGATGPAGPAGPAGPSGTAGSAGPAGPAPTATVNLAFVSAEAWENAKFQAAVTKVTTAAAPVVEFSLSDEQGNPVIGLDKVTSRSATATVAQYPNISFALAKLMPRTDNKPSSWVSYIVTTVPTTTTAAAPTRPSTDNTGRLEAIADKPGHYRYTFYRDVTAIKAQVDGMTVSGANNKAQLGDLSWQPNLPHRLTIQFSGAAPGTGSNTPTGAQTRVAVNMANPLNVIYDFVPATGRVLTAAELTREDVNIDSCNTCHGKLAFHGGSARVETRYCVVCHTEQRGYGFANVASTAGKFPVLTETKTVNAATGITSYSYAPETRIADGEVLGNFTTMIHKIHQGHTLVKDNYHYAGLAMNNKGFSKLGGGQRMCSTCHDNKVAATADNHRNLPSRVSCGACHDGINWATGGGSTLADKAKATAVGAVVAQTGHLGGPAADDATCAACHTPTFIKISHRMENITKNNPEITAGLASFTYDIKSATVNAANDVIIEFGIRQRIAPSTTDTLVTLVAPAATVANPLAGFTGGPSFLLPYALSQDGITTPVDYNNLGRPSAQPRSVSLAQLLSTNNAANGTVAASTTTPGYYVATIKGSGQWSYPAGARLRSVALQGYFNQITEPATPASPNGRHAISVVKAVTGDAVRRTVVDANKCANCHEWFEAHGGNRVFEPQVCVVCHVPGLATSGRGIADATLSTFNFSAAQTKILADWGFNKALPNAALKFPVTSNNFKDMIHGIHAGRERVTPFQDARDSTSRGSIDLLDFRRMDFPGKLNNCETCHVTAASTEQKTYNYVPGGTLPSVHESIDAVYAAGIAAGTATPAMAKAALNTASATDIVTTPFAASCVSCHDRPAAKAHITLNGGVVNATRASARPTGVEDVESCAVCHGPGREFDAVKIHR